LNALKAFIPEGYLENHPSRFSTLGLVSHESRALIASAENKSAALSPSRYHYLPISHQEIVKSEKMPPKRKNNNRRGTGHETPDHDQCYHKVMEPLEGPTESVKRMLFAGDYNYDPNKRQAVHTPITGAPVNPHINYRHRVPLGTRLRRPRVYDAEDTDHNNGGGLLVVEQVCGVAGSLHSANNIEVIRPQ
jgi:hypothetical protein